MVRLEYILKEIRKDAAGTPRKERRPITPSLLKRLFAIWESRKDLKNAKMLWAAACLAFFAFLRIGEFTLPGIYTSDGNTHLTVSDVSLDDAKSPSMVFIKLKQSKMDQLRKGVKIVLRKTNRFPLCPVSALLSYLAARGTALGPLFIWENGHFLTRAQFVVEVRRALEGQGEDTSELNGHSLWIGAASTVAANGMEDSLIKTLGRWESDAYKRYIKIPRKRAS